ncbi:hypothetical protein QAA18_00820 [Luteimonas sp. 8-5]|uniref:tetratricopeptide repeat protein n=1 Tax=Luteimonas sp. 8-5 TaxID=3039387 RepID=UPI002436777E|nr:hypothetical protein [Luteimonas sp. 8-5]MDG6347294.1 hypothetical protein [Luteimonas sp. 8-5]
MTTLSTRIARPTLLAFALALALPVAAPVAMAQSVGPATGQPSMSPKQKREAARRAKEGKATGQKAATPAQYPQATREEPEANASRRGAKKLQDLVETYNAGDDAATVAAALEIATDADSNAYEQAFAYQIAGTAVSGTGDDAAAAEYFTKAIEANGLGNNDHYTAMLNLAVVQYTLDKYEDALATIERFLTETRSDKPEALNLRGGALMGLERYAEAAEVYAAQVAANPEDKVARMNAVAAYQQAKQDDKAVALLADAQAKGQLGDANEYRALYVSYLNSERDKDALAVIEEGLAKGILKEGPELARAFMIIGQNAYFIEDEATALAMYERAAPMADDGEAALNLAKLYVEAGNKAKAKAAAELALSKGVKDTAQAKRLAAGK